VVGKRRKEEKRSRNSGLLTHMACQIDSSLSPPTGEDPLFQGNNSQFPCLDIYNHLLTK
jgi:hypothetical protein